VDAVPDGDHLGFVGTDFVQGGQGQGSVHGLRGSFVVDRLHSARLARHFRLQLLARPLSETPMKTYRIATIPGDGIGKEVIPAGQQVLQALAERLGTFALDFENFGWGGDWYRAHGQMMPADGLEALRGQDAVLFGSAGDPQIPDHITLWGLRLKICQGFDQYANVRPTRILPGIDAPLKRCRPQDLDWVIVRENSEGEYAGVGGRAHQGHPIEVATDVSMMTRAGVERIMRFAFRLAQSRPRKLLTVVTKSNAQRHAMVMWDEIALQVAGEFADVRWDKELVDAMTARMVNRPATIDTVVATNLHADILSDLAAALAGSLGIAPTGNIDPERRYPSMFEPIHGSAFDIMGKGLANPVGTFWSCVMLLEHLGEARAAAALMAAIEAVTADPALHTRDLGGTATTDQVTAAVCQRLAQA
jgi:tartrate dehydrogenase/decarboxylase/D-malate dehydrogenase